MDIGWSERKRAEAGKGLKVEVKVTPEEEKNPQNNVKLQQVGARIFSLSLSLKDRFCDIKPQ